MNVPAPDVGSVPPMAALLEAARRRNPLPTGHVAVGAGLIVAGCPPMASSRRQHRPEQGRVLAARPLWSLVFLLGPACSFRSSRRSAGRWPSAAPQGRGRGSRRAPGRDPRGRPRPGGAGHAHRHRPLVVDQLFDHQILLLVGLALGLAGRWPGTSPGAACRARGTSRATAPTWADGLIRVLGCVLCAAIGVKTAGWFGIAIGIAGLLAVPVALRVERPSCRLARGGAAARSAAPWATCWWPRCRRSPS